MPTHHARPMPMPRPRPHTTPCPHDAPRQAELFAASPKLFPPEAFGLERYLWAHATVLCRAVPLGEEPCLVPLLDTANHEAR